MTTQELKNKIEKVLGNSIRCLLPSYWWKNLFHSVADSIEEVSTSVSNLSKELSDLDNYVDITRDELLKLVHDEKLIPGRSYRITDYECTLRPGINAYAYKNNEFAIIVKALSNWELDQNAKATFKPGTWSGRSRYTSWQLKYSIFNDIDKYPWAAHGTLEYDASVVLDNPPYSWYDEMVVIWDSTVNKYVLDTYVDDDGYRGYYLVTSETDKTPLAQTSFNYGDVVYINIFGDVYSAKISYTKAMRDSGDAVLTNYMYRTGVDYVRAFIWDTNENAYVSVVNTSTKLKDSEGNILSKRESFTKPEKMMMWVNEYLTTFGFYTPNGKGVIYYLKDSNNNEAYYDFKNIAFLFPEVSSEPVFTFDWDSREESESSYVKNVKIENAGDLNYVTFNVDPNEVRGGLDSVVVSSKVKNQYFNSVYKNTYIGYDDNNNLSVVNIFNSTKLVSGETIKTINNTNILGSGDLTIAEAPCILLSSDEASLQFIIASISSLLEGVGYAPRGFVHITTTQSTGEPIGFEFCEADVVNYKFDAETKTVYGFYEFCHDGSRYRRTYNLNTETFVGEEVIASGGGSNTEPIASTVPIVNSAEELINNYSSADVAAAKILELVSVRDLTVGTVVKSLKLEPTIENVPTGTGYFVLANDDNTKNLIIGFSNSSVIVSFNEDLEDNYGGNLYEEGSLVSSYVKDIQQVLSENELKYKGYSASNVTVEVALNVFDAFVKVAEDRGLVNYINGEIRYFDASQIVVDSVISSTSMNPIQNRAIKAYVDNVLGDINTILDNINGEEV